METQRKKHVLVLGCGRSGTSIFGELFRDSGIFKYLSEVSMDEIMVLDSSQPIALKVPRESDRYPADEGISFPLKILLDKLENNIQVFWIVRHPLDTICSLKVGIDKNWGHHPRPIDWKEHLDRPLLEKCAYHWKYINTKSFEKVKHLAHVVYFEEMLSDSRAFASKIFSRLSHGSVNNEWWAGRVQDANNSDFIEAITSREYSTKDHSKRVGRWKENMSMGDAKKIWPMIEEVASNFGYTM